MIKAVRGTRDLLPPDTDLWNWVEAIARKVFARYNFHEIRTPIFEDTQLFSRSVGEETDIVSKEMFSWEDKARAQSEKAQSLTLRPENTAGVVRAYIEHRLGEKGTLQKLYYIGPQFRRERPQKGRYRQFFQIGAEIIGPPSAGSESPLCDAELLDMLATLLDRVGLRGWELQLNSVGCAEDRARYSQALREALKPVVHQMCADCQRRAETNPLRVLDCKVPEDQPIIEKLPKISQYLDEPCREHFAAVRSMLDAVGIAYTINERMVRGLDYYTRTTFEFTHGDLGAQSAVLGGGRYDGLSEVARGTEGPRHWLCYRRRPAGPGIAGPRRERDDETGCVCRSAGFRDERPCSETHARTATPRYQGRTWRRDVSPEEVVRGRGKSWREARRHRRRNRSRSWTIRG